MYSNDFKNFVNDGVTNNYFIGTGNPNAQILIIGKESAIYPADFEAIKLYNSNASDWKNHIEKNTCEVLEYPVDKNNKLYKNWGKNTWSKYQKLNDFIFDKQIKSYYVDFLKTVFTTEINDSPNKSTTGADKSELNTRKRLFKKSNFIQQFPVIVLACSDYFQNNDNIREIDNVFNVKYDGNEKGRFIFNKGNWFFTHHNKNNSKLVIHTRQLSADIKNEMLEKMGRIIKQHLLMTKKQ